MNVLEALRDFCESVTLERPGARTFSGGYGRDGTPAEMQIQAAVQPLSAQELRNVPEGQNELAWINLWSETELRNRDRILRAGRTWQVQRVEPWPQGGFWKAQAVDVTE